MKRLLLFAVGIAVVSFTLVVQPLFSQIYTDFTSVTRVQKTYEPLRSSEDNKTTLNPKDFGLPPTFNVVDQDDGYFKEPIKLPFKFEFNKSVYEELWVNINGFVTFTDAVYNSADDGKMPPFVAPDNPRALFIKSNSYPINVVAPFWGNHYYRDNDDRFDGYKPSEISWGNIDTEDSVFVVEWKDLNINYLDSAGNPIKSSVGNFQIRIYRNANPNVQSFQGNIEFCYGQVGGNDSTNLDIIVARGASVGLKGEQNDFVNGLLYGQPKDQFISDTSLTNEWTPSGGTDWRIRFNAEVSPSEGDFWGDGDTDLSKAVGQKHHGMSQSRYVTVNDVRKILRAVATSTPLDSVISKEAFHGDVNHNGRFFYDFDGNLVNVPWRTEDYLDSLPGGVTSPKSILFKATEFDAGWILHYISARVPKLPWIYDTTVNYGKVGVYKEPATGFKVGEISSISDNQYVIPVYLNGYVDGPIAGKFDVQGELLNASGNITVTKYDNRVVFAGSGEFDSESPILILTVRSEDNDVTFNGVRFNDRDLEDISTKLTSVENTGEENMILHNTPNPFTDNLSITVNVPVEGNYTLAIYDMQGRKVKTIASGHMTSEITDYQWDALDEAGNAVNSGMYICRLSGDNFSITKNITLRK